jgi:hypothetical protein
MNLLNVYNRNSLQFYPFKKTNSSWRHCGQKNSVPRCYQLLSMQTSIFDR